MASENAEAAATAIERTMNQFGGREDAEHIVSHLLNMHRTLNQAFTSRIVLRFVQEMAKRYTAGRMDGRNSEACRLCRVMWDAVKADYGREDDEDEVGLRMI